MSGGVGEVTGEIPSPRPDRGLARLFTTHRFNEVSRLIETKTKTTNPQVTILFEWVGGSPSFLRGLNDLLTRTRASTKNFDYRQRLRKCLLVFLKRYALIGVGNACVHEAISPPSIGYEQQDS